MFGSFWEWFPYFFTTIWGDQPGGFGVIMNCPGLFLMASIIGGLILTKSFKKKIFPSTWSQKSFSDKQRWLQLKNLQQKLFMGEKRWYTLIFHFFGVFFLRGFLRFPRSTGCFLPKKPTYSNSSPFLKKKWAFQVRNLDFQWSIFRGKLLVFQAGYTLED